MKKIEDQTARPRRILILGSTPHTRLVDSYEWNQFPSNLTIADYDTVILNFTVFADKATAAAINIDRLPGLGQFAHHIFSQSGETIAIGSPNFQLGSNPYVAPWWWLPVQLSFRFGEGEEIRVKSDQFATYFKWVKRWSFFLEGIGPDFPQLTENYLAVGAPGLRSLDPTVTPLAETRFQRAIGFELKFYAYNKREGRITDSASSSKAYWLPEPTEISAHDAIDMLLRERYHIQFEREPPSWSKAYKLPAERPIREAIRSGEAAISELTASLDRGRKQLALAARFTKLLYEQGEDVLEPIVRDALRELGAVVEDPKKKGREDGRLTDPFGRQAVLEVKGRSGALKLSDVRELDQWVRDALINDGWKGKGLLVANLQLDDNPQDRVNYIPPNCLDAAKNCEICILTTTQLFRAIVDDQKKQLDRRHFWDSIFATNGLPSLPEAEPTKD